MIDHYSIKEARKNLSTIVQKLKRNHYVEITHRGKPVVILIDIQEFQRLISKRQDFWQAYLAFRDTVDFEKLGIDSSLFEVSRTEEPVHEVGL